MLLYVVKILFLEYQIQICNCIQVFCFVLYICAFAMHTDHKS